MPSSRQLLGGPEPMLYPWGGIPAPGREQLSEDLERLTQNAVLSRGLGRSYGDSSLPGHREDKVAGTVLANRILSFDPQTRVIRAEAGFCLMELNRLFLPQGLFSPVTPGTQFVTLGGMVASDVHGKNHHVAGCFGQHVRALRVRLADNRILECSPTEHSELFYGCIGGMGLLGHILEVEFTLDRIPSPWIVMEAVRVPDIDAYLAALNEGATRWPMTMGWIDCVTSGRSLGRGIMMAGRWAEPDEAPAHVPRTPRALTVPFDMPSFAVNPLTVKLFNIAYYWKQLPLKVTKRVAPAPFFYPLDAVLKWNRFYGRRGFTQYQCVIPRAAGAPAVRKFMELLTRLGGASPVCVIKDCGPEGKGLLSFPLEGTSIAVDIAITSGIQALVDALNEYVISVGGRVYLTKDRFTRPEHFRAMEPRLERFQAARDRWDPDRRLRSAQSVRLMGDPDTQSGRRGAQA